MTLRVHNYCTKPTCREAVIWLTDERTGLMAPINVATSLDGNVEVDEVAGTYRMVPEAERGGRTLHKRHWATCEANR